ncbi:MAG: hypothetical protein J1E39_01160 [Eubacterium sp.]|nr:hypothetical protein [Eubacterium sp.]
MKKTEPYKLLTLGLVGAIALIIPITTIIKASGMPERSFSETENRYLADLPKFSWESVRDEEFMEDFEEYFSDRFILREEWINIKNSVDRLLGKTEIKNIFTIDGRMMEAWKGWDEAGLNANLNAMAEFAENHSQNQKVYFMLSPNAQEIYKDTLPAFCGAADQKAFIDSCYGISDNIYGIDVYSALYGARNDYIFYRTDHHWTSGGAFLAYREAGEVMGYEPYSIDKFNIEHASNEFRGTLYSQTLDNSVKPDIIDFYIPAGGSPQQTLHVFDGEKTEKYYSLYFREYLDKKDKYSSFLGLNVPMLEIETELSEDVDKGSLLIFKDSYANTLIPFLTNHYSKITVLDLRYINLPLADMGVDTNSYGSILFMYNTITFSEDTNVRKLGFLDKSDA